MALKIIFMGTPEFAVPILDTIYKSDHKVLETYTQPPKKKNRGQKIHLSPIHEFSKKNNIPVRCPDLLSAFIEVEHIKNLKPDIVLVVAYGKLLPSKLLDLKNILFLNIHASILPKWRGAAPIQRAIMNMDKETGISIMKIIPRLDAGPILLKSKIKISKENNYKEVSNIISNKASELILEAFNLVENNKANFIDQNETEATYAPKIEKSETKINWNDSADKIVAKINALNPNPGCWFNFLGSRFKIIKAKEVPANEKPGKILDDNFTIACSKNAIQILELKKEGKKIMTVQEFLKGNKVEAGIYIN